MIARFRPWGSFKVGLDRGVPNNESLVVMLFLPPSTLAAKQVGKRRFGLVLGPVGSKMGIDVPAVMNPVDAIDGVTSHRSSLLRE
jgi:hypothetical protein